MTLEQTVILLSKRFSENDLPFCLAAGFAYSLYCEPRTTVDIDLVMFSAVKKEKINEILLKSFSIQISTAFYQTVSPYRRKR